MSLKRVLTTLALMAFTVATASTSSVQAGTDGETRYVVVFGVSQSADGSFSLDRSAALALVASAGGAVTLDLTGQIGVAIATSSNALFADVMRASSLVEEVAEDFAWKQFPTLQEALDSGALAMVDESTAEASVSTDPLEPLQWSMQLIRTREAHDLQTGSASISVGILDTGIDGTHLDFTLDGVSNVDCARGRDFIPAGPGIGNPDPCIDNGFHGTHVAGIVAARRNGHGVAGVAPNVTLVPVKVCDAAGFCYASTTAAGITYAGDAGFDVINMSFFVDDGDLLASTEFKCMSDAQQRAFRRANERALQYARSRGVLPVAALGNSDTDLAKTKCDVVPAESSGVVGVMALGPTSDLTAFRKAGYSSYGVGATDVAAPGGAGQTGNCANTVLSTIPGNLWGCIQGTSMASPHATGVAALIASQLGGTASPTTIESVLQGTAVDIGLKGYDKCFGNGRIDALRAVTRDTSAGYDARVEFCPEYNE